MGLNRRLDRVGGLLLMGFVELHGGQCRGRQ
jgi:hypothetical protein